ncbi:sulfotransferase [Oceaniglobus roseus]|uniref:sulfotransferase n=1 Tax=Oceaniglobus roseus TaxID=1737570 RepID=UPI0012FFDF6A|nr:sulfotransferase [Kandeliimicrobium roseum]
MGAPVLLLAVGATKSGTSWLHETLAGHPECHLRSVKELHYFDALDLGRRAGQIREIRASCDQLAARIETAPATKLPALAERLKDRHDWLAVLEREGEDPAAYLGYLTAGAEGARVVGDVTPAYALLPEERLRAMAALTDDVRFVYLMRDPVARLWSHVRMIAARRGPDGTVDPKRARNILNRTLRGEETEIGNRGDYRAALTRLRTAVAPEKLLVLFYEDIFGGGGMTRLCAFLGIAPVEGDTARRVHAGGALDMPGPLRDKAAAWLAPQYDFVARTMGRSLPEAWLANMARV